MINMLLKEPRDLGVLMPSDHAVMSLLNQGLRRVRTYEAVEAADDEDHCHASFPDGPLDGC